MVISTSMEDQVFQVRAPQLDSAVLEDDLFTAWAASQHELERVRLD